MDEQIMSWATSRPEVSKDKNNRMVILSKSSNSKCLCVCALVFLIETGTYLHPVYAYLNELTSQILT